MSPAFPYRKQLVGEYRKPKHKIVIDKSKLVTDKNHNKH